MITTPTLPALPGLLGWLERTTERLAMMQHGSDGPTFFRGEFPMWLTGAVSRADHNYLSGYALLHVALAARCPDLPPHVAQLLGTILRTATDLPARYQSCPRSHGLRSVQENNANNANNVDNVDNVDKASNTTSNWYSGRGSDLPAPARYPWPQGRILCLHDDYDDTAISVLLSQLGPFRLAVPASAALFLAAAYDPARDQLAPKSIRRLHLTGMARDVYQSWALPTSAPVLDLNTPQTNTHWLPDVNSVELSTVANVFTAVHMLTGPGGAGDIDEKSLSLQCASRTFINALTHIAVGKLLEGDASYLDFASSYYPRVPFAPLAFLVHNHVLTSGALLDPSVVERIAQAVVAVDPHAGWRSHGFANAAYWLNCCAWCVAEGLLGLSQVHRSIEQVWAALCAQVAADGLWPDIVFFHAAHLGDYSGLPYAQALMIETMAQLHAIGAT